jgi:hypothetical protein
MLDMAHPPFSGQLAWEGVRHLINFEANEILGRRCPDKIVVGRHFDEHHHDVEGGHRSRCEKSGDPFGETLFIFSGVGAFWMKNLPEGHCRNSWSGCFSRRLGLGGISS